MGKVEDMRAMREARYARNSERPEKMKAADEAELLAKARKVAEDPTSKYVTYTDTDLAEISPCGHRAISGKTCIRPKDHTEKNHKYTVNFLHNP